MYQSVWRKHCFTEGTLMAFAKAIVWSSYDIEIDPEATKKWIKKHGHRFQAIHMPEGQFIGLVPKTKMNRDVDWQSNKNQARHLELKGDSYAKHASDCDSDSERNVGNSDWDDNWNDTLTER
ncbi:MAG: hypothetical protein KAS32_10575 [Candidatus Peribacteraceae bacterium]|nr:hypothetical protein [Candidatus Peribacteraceae bacterium]